MGKTDFRSLSLWSTPLTKQKRLRNISMISIVSVSSSFCKVCHYLFKTKIYVRELYMLWWVFKKTFDISVHFSAPKLMLICRILPCNSLHQPFCMSQSLFITLWLNSHLFRLFLFVRCIVLIKLGSTNLIDFQRFWVHYSINEKVDWKWPCFHKYRSVRT